MAIGTIAPACTETGKQWETCLLQSETSGSIRVVRDDLGDIMRIIVESAGGTFKLVVLDNQPKPKTLVNVYQNGQLRHIGMELGDAIVYCV